MATRTATARWSGTLKEGSGRMAVGSGAFEGPYDFRSRFEEGSGTNPEELIGAAHAGCYSMQLSAMLSEGGHPPDSVETTAKVHLRAGDEGARIARIDLSTEGRVPGIDEAAFRETAEAAKQACLVTRALAGVQEVTLEATLLD